MSCFYFIKDQKALFKVVGYVCMLTALNLTESFTVKKIILQLNPLWRTAVHKLSSRRVYLWGVGLFFSGWVY